MVASPNTVVLASEYNSVAEVVNKIFGDKYSTASVTDANRALTHKFGWGAVNIEDALTIGTDITAERLQDLVERTNVSTDRTILPDTILIFNVPTGRTDVVKYSLIRAEDLNLVESKFNTLLINNNHLTVDAANASSLIITPTGPAYNRTSVWQHQLNGEHKWTFNSYNHARYFFNGGGQLRVSMNITGGSTAGYYNWSDILNEMGQLNFTYDNVFESAAFTGGTSEGKGFYDLTENYGDGSDAGYHNEGLLYTSSGVTISGYGYGYGGASGDYIYVDGGGSAYSGIGIGPTGYSGYSGYGGAYQSMKFKLYGKWANGGKEVHFKLVLDDTSLAQYVDGVTTANLSLLMPDIVTYKDAEFDVNPVPTCQVTNSFNTSDDNTP